MVLEFRMVGSRTGNFFRTFEMKSIQTFFDFHVAIQEELGFDKNQLASFFLADNRWEKGLEINLFDMTEDTYTPVIVMERTQLCELLSEEGQRLIYVFDFFSDRFFFIELISVSLEDKDKTYPFCASGQGMPPQQIIIEDPEK